MQFRELVLHNVGVYRGRQAINLSTTEGRPVVLVGGLNGCGKTTFLDALQMALYGRRARLSNRGTQSWEQFLRASINRAVPAEDGASIELIFQVDVEGSAREYRVVRSWSAHGKAIKEFVTVFLNGKVDRNLSSGWADHVEELLPLDIASLFFFDGEKIESLADPETASTVVRTAVHSLLGIGTIEQLRTDLLALQRRQTPPSNDAAINQRIETLVAEQSRIQSERDATVQRLAELEVRRVEAGRMVSEIEVKFQREGGQLYERRNQLEGERSRVTTELQGIRDQLRAVAEGPLPLGIVENQLASLLVQAEGEAETQEAQRLLSHVEQRDARLLSQLDTELQQRVSPLLAEDRAALAARASTPLVLNLSAETLAEIGAARPAISHARAIADKLIAAAADLEERRDHIDSQLAGVPNEDSIAEVIAKRDDARLRVARLEGESVALTEEHARLSQLLETVATDLTKAEADRRDTAIKSDYVRRVLEHTDRVRATLAALRQRLIEQHIGKIEVATLEAFRALMRKSGLVCDLRIDNADFSVHLVGADGEEIPSSRLSAGERQLLAVALLWGLARVAGNRLPTVIDTPLGRLDSQHRKHLVERYFPNASSQVLLLSTDEEIDEELLRVLSPSLANTYLLSHDDQRHVTTIERGYWWPVEVTDVA